MQIRFHAGFRSQHLILALSLAATPCYGHGGFHEEIKATDALIAADPSNAGHWFHRGQLNYLHGDWMLALMDLEKTEHLAPGEYPVGLVRGQAWMAGGKFPQARTALDAFVKANPDVPDGYTTRARLMLKLEQPDAAVADFKQALAKTRSPEPDLYVETADAMIVTKHPEDAVKELDAGISRLGEIPSLACKALELEVSLGLYDAALSRVAAIQQSAPRPEPWMAKRASVLAQAGRMDDSQMAWMELREHILTLPDRERGSHAMSGLLEQTQQALETLAHTEGVAPKPSTPPPL